jgi:hypothetical protein
MRHHPTHSLLPVERQKVYDYLGDLDDISARRRRGRLALLAAHYVGPIWRHERPHDDRFDRLLALASSTLRGTTDAQAVREEQEKAWNWIAHVRPVPPDAIVFEFDDELRDMRDPQDTISASATLVYQTALEAVVVALGEDRFKYCLITDHDTDYDLEVWYRDAAACAAMALAGQDQLLDPDNVRRLEFWTWWLTEAVPEAWQAEQ